MKVAAVDLGDRSYAIHIHRGSIENVGQVVGKFGLNKRCLVITNDTVGQIYGEQVTTSLEEEGFQVNTAVVQDSESAKSLEVAEKLYREAYGFRMDRNSPVIALGGGVVGDLAGFVAATYMRGLPFFQIPTTLLSQVDSSVGGKVAVNYLVKNLVGCFYQPLAVVIDPATLDSLPAREFRAGMGEVIKYGVMWDSLFFDYLDSNVSRIRNLDPRAIEKVIYRACCIKAEVVSRDEREAGLRAVLNLGHTFGHAVEVAGGFGGIKHGEAVAIGMCISARLSESLGLLASYDRARITGLVEKFGLPISVPYQLRPEFLAEIMTHDKKNTGGAISLILPTGIGKVEKLDFDKSTILSFLAKISS